MENDTVGTIHLKHCKTLKFACFWWQKWHKDKNILDNNIFVQYRKNLKFLLKEARKKDEVLMSDIIVKSKSKIVEDLFPKEKVENEVALDIASELGDLGVGIDKSKKVVDKLLERYTITKK